MLLNRDCSFRGFPYGSAGSSLLGSDYILCRCPKLGRMNLVLVLHNTEYRWSKPNFFDQFTVWLWVYSLLIPSVSAFASPFNVNSSPEVPVFPVKSVNGPPGCLCGTFSIRVFLQILHTSFPDAWWQQFTLRCPMAAWSLLCFPYKAPLRFEK